MSTNDRHLDTIIECYDWDGGCHDSLTIRSFMAGFIYPLREDHMTNSLVID